MACSSQSASDYVRQARVHLIRELKNLSAIVENLYLHKILNDEEVSELQAETDEDKTRKILDSVLRKGEAACYEFLRIIYMTRRRTSGRPSPLPEKKSEASAETTGFDLQFWISCFPFEEDTCGDMNYLQGLRPCHRYQAKLKSKAIKMSEEFWMANKCLFDKSYKPDLSYMPLVLDAEGNISPSKIKKSKIKKSMMSRAKMLKTYIPEYKPEISPSDLLKIDKNIVLVGPAGIGKTALTLEMLKLWAESDSEDLDYMFYFDMRDTSEVMKSMSLEDLLFSVFSEPDEGKEEVLDDIKKNSDNVTIIFDGITDLCSSVAWRLATKDLLPDAKIIITCRPDDEEDFFPWDFLRVEVKGFSEQSIKTYLSAALGSKQSMVLSNLELLTLCHVPMYALMVAACISSGDSPQPCTITEVYICVVRLCLQTTGSKTETRHLNSYITSKRSEILSLAEVAFYATEGKSVNLTELPIKDNTVLSFLKPLVLNISSTTYAFHHYTMQEFFAALWLLKNPDKVKAVLQQCLTEEMKHMRHLIPFMCRLLHEKNPSLMKYLIPPEELKNTSSWFLKEMISTFCDCQDEADTEGGGSSVDILFLCQCLYESQCPEACIYLLDKLDYCLDLTGECLDPYSCCAVAYVVTQSEDKKIRLDLEDVTASEQGMRCLFGCLKNVQWCDPLPRQVWEIFLLSEGQMDYISLLDLDGNWMHLPVEGKRCLYERAVHVMKMSTPKVNVCLYWDWPTPVCPSLCACLLEALPYISSLSFRMTFRGPGSQDRDQDQLHGTLGKEEKRLLLDLCLRAALHKEESFHSVVDVLFSLFSVNTDLNNIHLDFYQHVQSQGYSSVIPKLRPFFQSAHGVWSIDLSQRKVSILLEVLKLQAEKKPVVLTGWSREESEVRSLLQCLPYISQLSIFPSTVSDASEFFGNLFCAAAEREQQTGEKMLELLSSVCRSKTFPFHGTNMDDDLMRKIQRDFLLDLFSRVEDYEAQTGLRFLPVLQSVFQSVPAVWSADLSEGKASILPKEPKMKRRSSLSPTAKRKGVFRLSYMDVPEGKTSGVPDVKLGPSRADTKPGVSEDDTKPMQPPLRFKPPLKTKCSSWMTFRGPGSQDRDQDQLHAGVPDVKLGPSRADTKPGVSEDDTKPMQPPLRFKPPLKTKCSSWMTFRGPGSQDRDQDQLHGFPDVKLGPSRADTKPGVSEDDTKPMQPPLRFKPPLKTKCSSWMTFRGPGSQDRDQDQLHGFPDVKLGPSRADTKPGVSEDDTKPMQPPLRFKPPLKTKCSSWMTFRGPGSQDRDQDQLHAGFPDVKLGPSRADTKPGVSEDDTKPMQPPLRFKPPLKTDSTSVSYSFKCPGPGQFQCALTGLVFVMTQKAELFYKTVQWDEGLLQSASKIAAGPLFDIKCPEDAVCQLHLPHCVSNDDLHYKRLLSVIHITDDGMSILKPLEITETHVIVKVPHLSCYGLAWPFESIWKFWRDRKVISSQVLLFLRPPNPKTQRKNLNVFLLPRNVPLEEVIAKHRNSEYIEAPSKCKLIKNQNYTVHCPNAYKIQPEEEEFDLDYGPNYHPTFEIRLPIHTEDATITVRDQANANVWEREVDLTGPGRETVRSASAEDSLAAEDNLPPEDRLLLVRRRFITGVSDAVLDQLLDRLLERGVVTDDEMQLLRTKIKPEKARDFIDIVRRKGTEASSVLIAALREGDPCLFRALALS